MRAPFVRVAAAILSGSAAVVLGACAADAPLEPGPPAAVVENLANSADGSYVLSGTVSGDTGEPITGARVVARPIGATDPQYVSTDVTHEDGYFVVSGLPRSVILEAAAPGYNTTSLTVTDVVAQPDVAMKLVRVVASSGS